MASRIQGITVEIGGDTTKLSSALSGVNKEIKNTQSQLKDVEKLLKLDPTAEAAPPWGCHQRDERKAGHLKDIGIPGQ